MSKIVEHSLERRVTHRYRDGWRNLDEWETMGTYTVRRRFAELLDDGADDEPGTVLLIETALCGDVAYTAEQVAAALNSTLSGSSCTHDYDCCGCVSTYARAQHMGDNCWMVLLNYTRNY